MSVEQDRSAFRETESDEKETARVYLRVLSEGHRRLFGMLRETQECLDGFFPPPVEDNDSEEKEPDKKSFKKKINKEIGAAFQEWMSRVGPELTHWLKTVENAFRRLQQDPKMAKYARHDVNNDASNAIGYASLIFSEINSDGRNPDPETFSRYLRVFVSCWERYWAPVQDILLRYLHDTKVSPEQIHDLDLGMLRRLLENFETQEMVRLKQEATMEKSDYYKIGEKVLKLEVDWQGLPAALHGGTVKGNEGVIYNFILNSLRNALKDRVEARNVAMSLTVDGDELVARVVDDGKGINSNGLTPDSNEFIFKEGSSRTKSTGLGLAYSDQRIKSVGGSLSVVSFNKEEREINTFSNASDFKFDLDEFNQNREAAGGVKMNTVFEIRLPIIKKLQ